MNSANPAASPSLLKIRYMDHDTGPHFLSRRQLARLVASVIILLTANITTLLVAPTVSAQSIGIIPQQISEH
jgi:hypothetical protein